MKKAIAIRLASAGALAALCSGCPDPNIYGTPRTTPVGKFAHTVAIQSVSYSFDNTKRVGGVADHSSTPLVPSYQLRIGVLDTLDIGIRATPALSLGADVKWNFIKTHVFDMAVDPGIQAWDYDSCSTDGGSHRQVYGNLPLLFGVNVSDSVSIVPTAGITYGCTSRVSLFGNNPSQATPIRGVMIRGGFGVELRVSPKFGLHPELTYLRYVGSNSEPVISWVMFGMGLNFGALPHWGGN